MLGRLFVVVPIAAVVTLALFFLMQALITPKKFQKVDDRGSINIEIARQVKPEVSNPNDELKPPTSEKEPPKPPKIDPKMERSPHIRGPQASMPNLNPDFSKGINLGGVLDGDVQPIVRVPPQYPARALQRGLEGWVIVEFTIDKDGSVTDPKVVKSSSSIFERSALRTIVHWKYRPQIVDGKPRVRPGVRTRIEFHIEKKNRR